MKKIIIALIAILATACALQAQETRDVLYLKKRLDHPRYYY